MEQLFVYGSLKKLEVQKSVFGRAAKASPDILKDYTRAQTKIDKMYPIIFPKKGRFVRGLVFSVNSKELQLIDAYETKSYRRQKVFLRSGVRAWVYTK